jgi:hypothetical protein
MGGRPAAAPVVGSAPLAVPPEQLVDPLVFSCPRVATLTIFALNGIREGGSVASVRTRLLAAGLGNVPQSSHEAEFAIAEQFGARQLVQDPHVRLHLGDYRVVLSDSTGAGTTPGIRAYSLLGVYPDLEVGVVMVSMTFDQSTTDQMVFVQQASDGRFPIRVTPDSIQTKEEDRPQSIAQLTESIIDRTRSALNATGDELRFTSRCIEIRSASSDSIAIVDAQDFLSTCAQQVYGLLTADEGWRSVPIEVARQRVQSGWETRSYAAGAAISNAVISICFVESPAFDAALENVSSLRRMYGQKVERHFLQFSDIAGLSHGPLIPLERVSIQRFILSRILQQDSELRSLRIRDLLVREDEMAKALDRLSYMGIPEFGRRGEVLQQAMQVPALRAETLRRLGDVERYLTARYSERTNLLLIALTVVTVSVGVLALLANLGFFRP